jgi:hypothetical protein
VEVPDLPETPSVVIQPDPPQSPSGGAGNPENPDSSQPPIKVDVSATVETPVTETPINVDASVELP